MGLFGRNKKSGGMSGKKIEPKCAYCENGKPARSKGKILCQRNGIVDGDYSCKKYKYSPILHNSMNGQAVPEEPSEREVISAPAAEEAELIEEVQQNITETEEEYETVSDEVSDEEQVNGQPEEEKEIEKPFPAYISAEEPEPVKTEERIPKPVQTETSAAEQKNLEKKIPETVDRKNVPEKPRQEVNSAKPLRVRHESYISGLAEIMKDIPEPIMDDRVGNEPAKSESYISKPSAADKNIPIQERTERRAAEPTRPESYISKPLSADKNIPVQERAERRTAESVRSESYISRPLSADKNIPVQERADRREADSVRPESHVSVLSERKIPEPVISDRKPSGAETAGKAVRKPPEYETPESDTETVGKPSHPVSNINNRPTDNSEKIAKLEEVIKPSVSLIDNYVKPVEINLPDTSDTLVSPIENRHVKRDTEGYLKSVPVGSVSDMEDQGSIVHYIPPDIKAAAVSDLRQHRTKHA